MRKTGLAAEGADVVVTALCRLERTYLPMVAALIDAVAALPKELGVHLLLVGDGRVRQEVETLRAAAERRAGRALVTMTGALTDPLPAYAMTDLVAGRCTSVLRGMAFGKPGIAVNDAGEAMVLSPAAAEHLALEGAFTAPQPSLLEPLTTVLTTLAADPGLRRSVGAYGRSFVEEHRSASTTVSRLEDIYDQLIGGRQAPTAAVASRVLGSAMSSRARQVLSGARRRALR